MIKRYFYALILLLALPFIDFRTLLFPHRYAKKEITRVRYTFSRRADEIPCLQDNHDCEKHGTGTIVDYVVRYETPNGAGRKKIGIYSCGNDLFPEDFIVRDDVTGKLLTVSRNDLRFTAAYGVGIPIFYQRKPNERFIRDFDVPLKAYPGDNVELAILQNCRFEVEYVEYTKLGKPRYRIRWPDDLLSMIEVAVKYVDTNDQEKYSNILKGFLCDDDFKVVSRGNMYYLHNNGCYNDFVFANLSDEVSFWSFQCGEWLGDTQNRKEYDLERVISAIERGEFDTALPGASHYSPIRILSDFEAFREFARNASLRQLRAKDLNE